jgi:phosphatidylinositol-3-phosphatase
MYLPAVSPVVEELEHRSYLAAGVPTPEKVVIVVLENKSLQTIMGHPQAPYINALARKGALLTNSHGVMHPSQPNYFALFAGKTLGVTSNYCPQGPFDDENLYTSLKSVGRSFAAFSQGLPAVGSEVCVDEWYERKHNPVPSFSNVPKSANRPTSMFPKKDFSRLPTVSLIVPDEMHNMHDGPIGKSDRWVRARLSPYVRWAKANDSLLVITFDEDGNDTPDNRIPTILYGPMVEPGKYRQFVSHYNVLRTVEDMYDAPRVGKSAQAKPIFAWKTPVASSNSSSARAAVRRGGDDRVPGAVVAELQGERAGLVDRVAADGRRVDPAGAVVGADPGPLGLAGGDVDDALAELDPCVAEGEVGRDVLDRDAVDELHPV